MEIERKYLVKTLPDHLEPVSYTHLLADHGIDGLIFQ